MTKNKPKLIIVEGGQGVGKGTFTNLLREKIKYTSLMRLSGIADKSADTGREKVRKLRMAELENILCARECETNFVMDRCFITEKVYCNLGFKEYDFQEEYDELLRVLDVISQYYDTYVILLVSDEESFEQRLVRDKATYEHSRFSVDNSMMQQAEYYRELLRIQRECENITGAIIKNDGTIEEVYNKIAEICNL